MSGMRNASILGHQLLHFMATLRRKQGQKNKARTECKGRSKDFKVPANGGQVTIMAENSNFSHAILPKPIPKPPSPAPPTIPRWVLRYPILTAAFAGIIKIYRQWSHL